MKFFHKENPAAEQKIERYFALLAEKNEQLLDGKLSVLLLGSLSRGEGTWTQERGHFQLLSDIEFFTVFPAGFTDFARWDQVLADARQTVFCDEDSVLFHIDNTYVCRDTLPKMERKLLTFDAMNMGVTVVGEDLRPALPRIDLRNINFCDLRDIMTHRVFSVLYYGFRMKRSGDLEGYRYCLAKNSLDLMTVLLVMHGQLLSGFENRCRAVQALPLDETVKDYFRYCLAIKFGEDRAEDMDITAMEKLFIDISDELQRRFRVPVRNYLMNAKSIIRRNLGKLKRAVRYGHLPALRHYWRLSQAFRNDTDISEKSLRDNLVLNGYPILS